MNEKLNEFIGYHGTKKYSKSSIERDGFIKSPKGWLGEGTYFFQEDYQLAINWAKKKHNTIMVCFIKRKIRVRQESFFDIVWPLSDDSKYFFSERENYVKSMEKKGYIIEVDDKKRFEGEVIDLICKRKNYSVARACTYTYQKFDEIYKLNSIFDNGVEICVKDHNCIVKEQDNYETG